MLWSFFNKISIVKAQGNTIRDFYLHIKHRPSCIYYEIFENVKIRLRRNGTAGYIKSQWKIGEY